MSSDEQSGRMQATLEYIVRACDDLKISHEAERVRSSEHRAEIHNRISKMSESTMSGLSDISSRQEVLHGDHRELKSAFESHVSEDSRRFNLIWKILGPIAVLAASAGAYTTL